MRDFPIQDSQQYETKVTIPDDWGMTKNQGRKHGHLVSREVNKQHSNIANNLGRPHWKP